METIDSIKEQLKNIHNQSFTWCMMLCGFNRDEAEEVLQTSYHKVFVGKARYHGKAAFKTWFFSVLRITSKELRRRNAVRKFLCREKRDEIVSQNHAFCEDDRLQKAQVQKAVAQLPKRQREMAIIVYYQGYTIEEASRLLNVSLGTARTHCQRARKKLQILLKEME